MRSLRAAFIAAITGTSLLLPGANAVAAPSRPNVATDIHPAVLQAMQRDLGLDAAAARKRLAAEAAAATTEATLIPALGAAYAGSWFDAASGKLVVGVTTAPALAKVQRSGATGKLLPRSFAALDAVKRRLDAVAQASHASTTGVRGWHVDMASNSAVVTLAEGTPRGGLATAAASLPGVRFETTSGTPVQTEWLDGGESITGCSLGFNGRLYYDGLSGPSDPIIITAGHCSQASSYAYGYANTPNTGYMIGPWWLRDLSYDWAVAGFTDPTRHWIQGPWISLHTPADDVMVVRGSQQRPIGSSICKSGVTTKITCGVIRQRNESVPVETRTIYGMTRHTACVEKGDSGGPNYSSDGQAQGITTAALLQWRDGRLRCMQVFGAENRSFYQEIGYIQGYTGARISTG